MVKIGLLRSASFDMFQFSSVIRDDFELIKRGGVDYMKVRAFDHYIDGYPFDMSFSEEEYEAWLVDFVYFLIPTDFVGYIDHYAGFVKEAFPHMAFNIICATKEINVEGNLITVPTSVVNVIPCSVTHFTEEGLQVLESVIGSWNNQNESKIINMPYKFERYKELETFINMNKIAV